MLGHGPSRTLNEAAATRGERDPTAALGFDPLPADNAQLKALHDALELTVGGGAVGTLCVDEGRTRASRSQAMAPRPSGSGVARRRLSMGMGKKRPQALPPLQAVNILTQSKDTSTHEN